MKRIFLFCTIAAILASCSGNGVKNPVTLKLNPAQQQVTELNNDFSFSLLSQVYIYESLKDDPKENIILSPLSASMMLSMAMNGADGETLKEMQDVLGFDDMALADINEYNLQLIEALPRLDKTNTLKLANSIWVQEDFPLYDAFKKVNQEYYNATVQNVNFSEQSSFDQINRWASDNTNKLIKKVISPSDINAYETKLILANALYFKGIWDLPFKKKETNKADFTNSKNQTVQVDRMNLVDDFQYAEFDYGQVLEMNYEEKRYCMDIVLPSKEENLSRVMYALDAEQWNDIVKSMGERHVTVGLPKFKLEYNTSLVQPLQSMGMTLAFMPGLAEFPFISPKQDELEGRLRIGQIRQFCVLNVDEEGTEAAAVTWGGIKSDSAANPFDPVQFIVDRPFLVIIREKQYGTILFIAAVNSL